MPVDLSIVESTTELGQTVVEVVLESASEPGPAGPGVPTGGTDGQVLTKASATDFDTEWVDQTAGGGGAPSGPAGGVLGGTYPDPTFAVDMATQAELNAAVSLLAPLTRLLTAGNGLSGGGDLSADRTFAVNVDGSTIEINADTLRVVAGVFAAAVHAHAGEDITSGTVADARIAATIARDSEVTSAISALSSVYQPLDSDLTAIAALTTTSFGRAFLAFADEAAFKAGVNLEAGTDFPSLSVFNDHNARHEDGGGDEMSIAGLAGIPTELQTHLDDTTAHTAAHIPVVDSGGDYTATDVEGVLAEIAPQLGGGGGLYDAYARLWDEKSATTDGGTFTSGADRTRDLNQEHDPDGIVTLSSNQFTLQAGTYKIAALAPALQVAQHVAWIYNTSDSAVALLGQGAYCDAAAPEAQTNAMVVGEITIAAQKTFELRHRCVTTKATNGFGSQITAIAGASIYSVVEIWRRA